MKNEDIIPQYELVQKNYTPSEKILLGEIRENLVDLAMSSGETFRASEDRLLNDIRNFLILRLNGSDDNTHISQEYLDRLSHKFLRDINGYGEIDPLIQDDELEEIMVIGTGKPVFVYHRKYGMMKTNLQFSDERQILDLIDTIARQINRRIDQESPILD